MCAHMHGDKLMRAGMWCKGQQREFVNQVSRVHETLPLATKRILNHLRRCRPTRRTGFRNDARTFTGMTLPPPLDLAVNGPVARLIGVPQLKRPMSTGSLHGTLRKRSSNWVGHGASLACSKGECNKQPASCRAVCRWFR